MKKADATMQHWFSNAYIKFFEKEEKSWKRLTQQRNTDFHTSRFYYQKSWVSFLYRSLFSCNIATLILKRTYQILKKKTEIGRCNHATWVFERIYLIFEERRKKLKRLTQQRNTDFHTSRFYHQKSWVSFLYKSLFSCNNATLILKRTYKILRKKNWKGVKQPRNTDFRTHISNFLRKKKKAEKGWRNNATLIFIHLDSTTKKAEFPSCTEVFSHATLPHWYWNAPIKFWRKKLK